jgi:hypothetical protein
MKQNRDFNSIVAAARALPVADHVPYAFEKRIMAVIRELPAPDAWTIWARVLWRAAAPCVGVMLFMTVWTAWSLESASSGFSLDTELEQTLLAPLAQLHEAW